MNPLFFYPEPISFRWIKRLLWFYIGVFVFEEATAIWFGSHWIESFFGLTTGSRFQPWRFITYSFLHGDFWHIFFNLFLFYGLARFLLQYELNFKKFLCLYAIGTIAGGLLWFWIHSKQDHGMLIGASAGIATLLTYFCLLYPEKSISIFLFFVFPIQIKARWCLIFLTFYELFNGLFYELQGISTIAHSAHLGGILVGFLAVYFQNRYENSPFRFVKSIKKAKYQVHIEHQKIITDVPFEVLKKVQELGLNSLSDEERRWLESYRKL